VLPPVTVRYVDPDPVVDPEVAKEMRASVKGCSRSAYLGAAHGLAYRRISPNQQG
jgi:hypothetical protein